MYILIQILKNMLTLKRLLIHKLKYIKVKKSISKYKIKITTCMYNIGN